VLVVVADVHERASGVPAALRALGAQVELQALAQGDYVVGYGTVVERKTVADLHASIGAGRFWQQMKKIRDGGRSPQLVLNVPGHPMQRRPKLRSPRRRASQLRQLATFSDGSAHSEKSATCQSTNCRRSKESARSVPQQ